MRTEQHAETLLPPGPGLTVRWLVAVPLMLLTSVLPTAGQLALGAWASLSFHDRLPDFGEPSPEPTFWSELREDFGSYGANVLLVPGVVLLVFLVRRSMFAAWPKACMWLGLWALGPATMLGSMLDDGDSLWPNVALGVGLLWLTYELGRGTLWVLSRPVARDLALSRLEVPYQVPGSRARLRVRRDHVRLDRLRAERGSANKTIRFSELREARLVELAEPTAWQASASTRIEVPAGPVLRITGDGQDWLLPVTEAMGEDLADLIMLRTHYST